MKMHPLTHAIARLLCGLFAVALISCGTSPQSQIIGNYLEQGDNHVHLEITRKTIVIQAAPLTLTFQYTIQSANAGTVNITYSAADETTRTFQAQIRLGERSIRIEGPDFHGTYLRQ